MIIVSLLDCGVLLFLLKVFSDEDVELGTAALIALATAIGTYILALGLSAILGIAGTFLAVVVAGVTLGVAVCAFFGIEIKRSMLIAVIFIVCQILIRVAWRAMLGRS